MGNIAEYSARGRGGYHSIIHLPRSRNSSSRLVNVPPDRCISAFLANPALRAQTPHFKASYTLETSPRHHTQTHQRTALHHIHSSLHCNITPTHLITTPTTHHLIRESLFGHYSITVLVSLHLTSSPPYLTHIHRHRHHSAIIQHTSSTQQIFYLLHPPLPTSHHLTPAQTSTSTDATHSLHHTYLTYPITLAPSSISTHRTCSPCKLSSLSTSHITHNRR